MFITNSVQSPPFYQPCDLRQVKVQGLLQNEAVGVGDPSPQSLPALTDEKSIRYQVCDHSEHQIQPKRCSIFMRNQSYRIDQSPFQMRFLIEKVEETHQTWTFWFSDTSEKIHQIVLLEKCGLVKAQLGQFVTK